MSGIDGGINLDELTADAVEFDNSTNGFAADNVQTAIEEVSASAEASKAFLLAQYNGNAIAGRYLEFFSGIASDSAPIESSGAIVGLEIVSRTTGLTATCTLGVYDIQPVTPVLLYTVTFTNEKVVTNTGTVSTPLFTLPAGGDLAVKVDSGSIRKPHIYFILRGA